MRACAPALTLSRGPRELACDRVRRLYQGQVRAGNMQILSPARAPRRASQEAEAR